jgi:WhiB family transcriptional regulator, redox-sensing transcriptional regulator
MLTHRHLERKYIELQEAIRDIPGGVGCAVDPTLFFPEDLIGSPAGRRDVINEAKAICEQCPIKIMCLDYAVSAQVQGIWGGTTESERKRR